MSKRVLISICGIMLSLGLMASVTPERYGAKGNGLADDTKALAKAFATGKPVVLDGVYVVSSSLKLKSSIRGKGTILFAKDDISITCTADSISIKGLTFDYQQHTGKMMRIVNASDVLLDRCSFMNVGTTSSPKSTGMLVITDSSHDVHVDNCRFEHCHASTSAASNGVWIQYKNLEDICHHIYIDNCYFDDFQTSSDADAVKVLGGCYDCYLYVSNCEFHRCDKRAMKFQARQCHSKDNVIHVSRSMYCGIDFQRGHGSSSDDSIVLDYDGVSEINPGAGLLYRGVAIAQGDVTVSGLTIRAVKSVENTHQAAFMIQSFTGHDDSTVSNVEISSCKVAGVSMLLYCSDKTSQVNGLRIGATEFEAQPKGYDLNLKSTDLIDCDIDYTKSGPKNKGQYKLDSAKQIRKSRIKVHR